ncbi:MAG: hypothetical protein Q4D96_07360 [Propionibacteriaceae bacterium]|nr:hypothetical protein [Propionibacteriaceae bacterium]
MEAAPFVTIAVMTVIVAITAGLFARSRSPRVLVAGLGLTLIPLALHLTGLSVLLVDGFARLITWAQGITWDNAMAWGTGLGVAGVLLLVLSGFLPRKERAAAPKEAGPKGIDATPRRPAVAAPQKTPQPARKAEPADDDIDEIEAILKRRGIS